MQQEKLKIYGYRWVVLLAFMAVIFVNQMLWITFASITGPAARFYGVSDLAIAFLSLSFMLVYIVVSIPASWVIDTYGIRVGVGIGAVLTGVFGLMRGLLAADYTTVLIAQIGIAVGQPFLLNAITKVAARWFPLEDRGTASGLGTLSMYGGQVVALALTPLLLLALGMPATLMVYGVIAVVGAAVFLIFVREHPPTPASPAGDEVRSLVFDGMRQTLRNRDFRLTMLIFFIGLGVFNGVTTWIEDIVRPRGFTITQAGLTGALMVGAGVFGALILPALSDRYRRRVPFIVLAVAASIFGLIGITFALQLRGVAGRGRDHGLLPAGSRADRLPVRRRGGLSRARGHHHRAAAARGPGVGDHLHPGDGSVQTGQLRLDDLLAGRPDRADGRGRAAVHAAARIKPGSWASSRSRKGNKETRMPYLVYLFPCLPIYQFTNLPVYPRAFAFSAFNRFITSFAPRPK